MEERLNKRNLAYEQQFNDIAKQAIIDSGLAKKEHREIKSHITQDMIDEYNNEQELLQQGPTYQHPKNYLKPEELKIINEQEIKDMIQDKIDKKQLEAPITDNEKNDLSKLITKFNLEINKINKNINKQQEILNKIIKKPLDVSFTNQIKEKQTNLLTKDIKKLNDTKNNYQNNINLYQQTINKNDILKGEIEKEKQEIRKENLEAIKKYQKEIQTLNPQKYIEKERFIGETEQEYLNRINEELSKVNVVNPVLVENQTIDKFKRLMKGIIRNDQKIENVLRDFIKKNELDKLNKINIRFEKFKNKYIKNFGENEVPTQEIIDFINEEYDKLEETKLNALERTKLNKTRKDETLLNETVVEPVQQEIFQDMSTIYSAKNEKKKEENLNKINEYLNKYLNVNKERNMIMLTDEKIKTSIKKLKKLGLEITEEEFKKDTKNTLNKIAKFIEDKDIIIKKEINEKVGLGIRKDILPKNIEFGKIKLMLDKLYHENILSVKYSSNVNIPGFTNTKVSDQFVKIIMDIYDGKEPKQKDLHNLKKDEKALFDKLMFQSKLHKKYQVDTIDETAKELKQQLEIIVGEIEAGNNGDLILNDLYKCVQDLVNIGAISRMNAKRYFEEIINKYFNDKPLGKHTLKK